MRGQQMEREMRQQADILAQNSDRYFGVFAEAFGGRDFDLVLLAARGSSDNAALYARYLIEIHLGIPVSLAAPSVLTRYGSRIRYHRALVVGVSQSGAAPDVSEVLAAAREDGHATLAITNTAGSRVTQSAEHALLLETGAETSVAATKTYSSTLLALYQLVRALGAEIPEPHAHLPGEAWLERCQAEAEEHGGALLRNGIVFALARGYSFCTAHETALKLMECALLPCKSFSVADFEHGPKALAGYGSAAIVYGEPAEPLRAQGCELVMAPRAPESVPELLHPLWDVQFGQALALRTARARGLDPDRARYLSKVTETL